jgi:hypothetical protein
MPRAVYRVKWRRGDKAPDQQRLALLYCGQFWKMLPRCRDGDLESAGPFQQAPGLGCGMRDILPCPFLR